MSEFILNTTEKNGFTILGIKGDIDASNVNVLAKSLDVLKERGQVNLVLDLTEMGHINSRGFGILVHRHQTFAAAGGGIKLAGLSQHNLMIFNILGGTQIFTIATTVADITGP